MIVVVVLAGVAGLLVLNVLGVLLALALQRHLVRRRRARVHATYPAIEMLLGDDYGARR